MKHCASTADLRERALLHGAARALLHAAVRALLHEAVLALLHAAVLSCCGFSARRFGEKKPHESMLYYCFSSSSSSICMCV